MSDIPSIGGASARQVLERFGESAARGATLQVSADGKDFKVLAMGQLSAASGATRSVAWVQSDEDTTGIFLKAMSQSYGARVSSCVARELGLDPSPGKPLASRVVQQALEMAKVSGVALAGVDFMTMLDQSAVADGRGFQTACAELNVDPKSVNADTRLWLDSQMKLRFDDANANGQSPVSPADASAWLKGLIASLKPSAN
ncbi:MAG: hypothetical protein K9J76_11040 [Polaromonas sp.]|nr:hypothetical protein [Polaromonas sp.]